MSRKLTDREVEVIRNADLTLRVESAVRKQWKMSQPPSDTRPFLTVSMQLFLPLVSSIHVFGALWPGHMPVIMESIAGILLMLFMLVVLSLLLLASVVAGKQPLSLGAISMMSQKRTWHTTYVRVLWVLLLASLAWSGKTDYCLMVIFFWLNSRYLIGTCQKSTRKMMVEIENDPNPALIELN